MRSNVCVLILSIATMSTFATAVYAVDDVSPHEPAYWKLSLGTGIGGSSEVNGFVTLFDLTLPVKEYALTLRTAHYDDTFGTAISSLFDNSNTQYGSVQELGALMSWVHYGQWSQRSIGAGVSYLTGTDVGINRRNFTALGVPVYAEAVFTPFRYFGIGIKASATLSSQHTLGVIFMTFNVGLLN